MRAKIFNEQKIAHVFDLDDTLIKSKAKIYVYDKGRFIKSLTPEEYSFFEDDDNYDLDFSDFKDPNLILNSEKYKAWKILEKIDNEIKTNNVNGDIFILTARTYHVRTAIFKLLKNNNIDIKFKNIITFGEDNSDISIAEEKKKILKSMKNKYDKIFFYDDNIDNINAGKNINGITSILIENKMIN